MFFDPDDYLERDPASAGSEREAAQLRRDAEHRARFLAAMLEVVGREGYEAMSIKSVVSASGLGRSTYYRLFADREACFLDTFEACVEPIGERVERGMASASASAARVVAGLAALVEALEEEPQIARLTMIEARVAGPASREAQQRAMERLARTLQGACAPERSVVEVGTARLIAGALATRLSIELRQGTSGELGRALPDLVYAALLPYLGPETAAREMRHCQLRLIANPGDRHHVAEM